jgi:Multiubiquitin
MINAQAGNEAQEDRTKRFKIIVNARSKEVTGDDQSFEQIVALAFNPVPTGPNIVFTVTFRKGPRENPEGTLTPGETVEIKDGMIFDVTATDKS